MQRIHEEDIQLSSSKPLQTQQNEINRNDIFEKNMDCYIYGRAGNILTELKKCPVNLRRMEYTISSLKAILLDAEEKKEGAVSNWLKELENVFSQIEESIIDKFKRKFSKQEGIGKQVCASFLCSGQIATYESKPTCEMKRLCNHLETIATKMYEFHLTEKNTASIGMGTTTHSFLSATEVSIRLMKPSWQLLYPLTDAPKVYRKSRYTAILNDFKNSSHGFFHIVGEAGIGKSTLAKFLYNDTEAVDMFQSRLWVCVKEEFDTQRLLEEIFSFLNCEETCDNLTDKQLFFKVQQYLRDRTFLLVFQDLSINNLDDCSMLKKLLMGNDRSKIIVTTQSEAIADALELTKVYKTEKKSKENQVVISSEVVDPVSVPSRIKPSKNKNVEGQRLSKPTKEEPQTIFKVERLSDENSCSLFNDYAFRDTQKAQNPELIEIANQIVKKCDGVPLAIKCLGSLLSSTTRIVDWKNVNNKLNEVKDGNILPTLRLCYNLMPSHLKRCFLHCSQLPNDRLFTSNDLIQLWMAHGLLRSPKENNSSLENIGEKYFMELWSRCFVQEIEEYGLGYWFKLHPLIQKLARVVAQEQAKCSVVTKPVTEIRSIAFRVRDMVPPSAFLVKKCISNLKFLRLLYLGNANLQEIPNAIGTLKYLRYLDLQGNKRIKRLPNSICRLQSLQTLILESCSALEELPNDITNLISLRYLWVTTDKLHLHKNGVGTMTSLRFIAIGGCDNLQELFERPECLEGLETLMIYNCVPLKSLPNEMRFLKSLQNLVIWSCKQLTLSLQEVEFRLQRFTIRELPKVRELPQWLRGSTETLRILEIINCPIKMEEEKFDMYKEVERRIIHGAVERRKPHEAARSNEVMEDLNEVKRGPSPTAPEMMRNYY